MTTLLEAARQALEALERNDYLGWQVNKPAIAALRQAIEQAEQAQPVVWMYQDKSTHEVRFQKHMSEFVDHSRTSEVPLYGEPLANHELQCVCGAVWCGDEMVHLPNKTPPRQPLTLEQLRKHWQVAKVLDMTDAEIDFADYVLIARDVEALYGIKGEAT